MSAWRLNTSTEMGYQVINHFAKTFNTLWYAQSLLKCIFHYLLQLCLQDMKIQALGKYCFYSLLCFEDNVRIRLVNWSKKRIHVHKRMANNKSNRYYSFFLMTGIHKCLNIKLLFNQDQKYKKEISSAHIALISDLFLYQHIY